MKKKTKRQTLDNTGQIKPPRDEKGRLLPGQSLNPAGKPPGAISITAMIKAKLSEIAPSSTTAEKKTFIEMLILGILDKAINKKDHQSQKMIWNYIDGMPKGSLDLTSGGKKLNTFDAKQLTAIAKRVLADSGESEDEAH